MSNPDLRTGFPLYSSFIHNEKSDSGKYSTCRSKFAAVLNATKSGIYTFLYKKFFSLETVQRNCDFCTSIHFWWVVTMSAKTRIFKPYLYRSYGQESKSDFFWPALYIAFLTICWEVMNSYRQNESFVRTLKIATMVSFVSFLLISVPNASSFLDTVFRVSVHKQFLQLSSSLFSIGNWKHLPYLLVRHQRL